MRKTNDTELTSKTHNSKASLEVRELKDELSDAELNTVSGGGFDAVPVGNKKGGGGILR